MTVAFFGRYSQMTCRFAFTICSDAQPIIVANQCIKGGFMENFKCPHNGKSSRLYNPFKLASGKNTGNAMKEKCDVEYFSSSSCGDLGVSSGEKKILMMMMPPSPELPYPLQKLTMWQGEPALEYVIPDNMRQAILEELYPFIPCPSLDDTKIDIHAQKTFIVRIKLLDYNRKNF